MDKKDPFRLKLDRINMVSGFTYNYSQFMSLKIKSILLVRVHGVCFPV